MEKLKEKFDSILNAYEAGHFLKMHNEYEALNSPQKRDFINHCFLNGLNSVTITILEYKTYI